jgi:methylthioribose-1-phosphate isomerase
MRTIEWDRGQVRLVDQRRLPQEYTILAFDDYQDVARAIREMAIRGAPAIGAAAAFGMALAARNSPAATPAELLADLKRAAQFLRATRPTAVNLSWAIERMLRCAQAQMTTGADVASITEALLSEAQALADEDVDINRQMGAHGARVVPQGARILTHCNAGALATVDYGTALGVVRAAHEQGKRIHVFVDETRPRLQGARLTAWELMREGIPMTLIADNAAGHLMRTGQIDLVLVGADRVAANGDVANKIGTYKLAVVAQENGIPFYVAAPTSTVDLSVPTGDDIPIEERDFKEVTHIGGVCIAPEGVEVYNLAFDVTPHRYVTGIITEKGILYPPLKWNLRKVVVGRE